MLLTTKGFTDCIAFPKYESFWHLSFACMMFKCDDYQICKCTDQAASTRWGWSHDQIIPTQAAFYTQLDRCVLFCSLHNSTWCSPDGIPPSNTNEAQYCLTSVNEGSGIFKNFSLCFDSRANEIVVRLCPFFKQLDFCVFSLLR